MEEYHRLAISEDSYSSTLDSFPCHVLYDRNYMACLDIGAAGTFSGNTSAPAIDWSVKADAQWYKNVSRDYLNASEKTGRNLFGVTCSSGGNESATYHGDGVINSFDIGVLIFVLFRDYPYHNIYDYANTVTVNQRPETQARCGNAEDRASWQADLRTYDYCPSEDYVVRRRLADGNYQDGNALLPSVPFVPPTNSDNREGTAIVYDDTLFGSKNLSDWDGHKHSDIPDFGAVGTHPIDKGFVRTRHGGSNHLGAWHGFEFAPTIVPVIVELILHGVWSEGTAILSNAPPPENSMEIPLYPHRHQVRWSRTDAQMAFAEPGTECNPVVTGATGTQTIIGDTLSVRQQGRGSNCPFWLHLWTPADSPKTKPGRLLADASTNFGDPFEKRSLSEEDVDPRTVWVKRGSSAMTTTGPVVLNPSNGFELPNYLPPPPSPPPFQPPLLPPPVSPVQYSVLQAQGNFTSSSGYGSSAAVEHLIEQIDGIESTLQTFISTLTETSFVVNVTAYKFAETTRRLSDADAESGSGNGSESGSGSGSGSGDDPTCDEPAVLEITVRFEGYVSAETMRLMQDDWPNLVNSAAIVSCGEIQFKELFHEPETEEKNGDDSSGMLIAIITTAVLLVVISCGSWTFAFRRSKKLSRSSTKKGVSNITETSYSPVDTQQGDAFIGVDFPTTVLLPINAEEKSKKFQKRVSRANNVSDSMSESLL